MDGLTGGSGGTEAFPLNELPVGFGMALAMNEQVKTAAVNNLP